jgi:hypothetical protein
VKRPVTRSSAWRGLLYLISSYRACPYTRPFALLINKPCYAGGKRAVGFSRDSEPQEF